MREFEFIQFVYTVRNIPDRICKMTLKFEKKKLKIGCRIVHVLSKIQNLAISRCCFVNFCKLRQRNEQRIITHAYTAIVLVAVVIAVEVFLIKLPKPNKRLNNEQQNEQKNKRKPGRTKRRLRVQKTSPV